VNVPIAVTQVQSTPNPNATKFILDRRICEEPRSFLDASQAESDSLAKSLFTIGGIASILILGDFVTVNKRPEVRWDGITRKVREILSQAP
jgi:hypothetical protein